MIKGFSHYKNKFAINTNEEIVLGLERMETFLAELGNPHHDLKVVHIAGTNGKGSTLQFLRHILMAAGYQVGTFTSPHVIDVNDQIATNKGPITTETFESIFEKLIEEIGDKRNIEALTDFELLTILAIFYFSKMAKPDIVLFEAGMGGLNDSTNVLTPLVSIITNISIEHTAFLGDTLEKIALQKAGIIKENVPCVTGVQQQEALKVVMEVANQKHSPLYILNRDFFLKKPFTVSTTNKLYEELKISLKGEHQKENAALAVMASELLNMDERHIQQGLQQTTWPGRFEIVSQHPTVVLDGAHNPASMEYVIDTIKREFPGRRIHFLFGAFKDKNCLVMLRQMEEIAARMTFVGFDSPRAETAANLYALSNFHNKHLGNDLFQTLSAEINQLSTEDVLIVTGSLYLLSEIKSHFGNF